MAVEMARNPWGIVNHHQQQGILELRWLPSTADMTDDDFKATLELFADQAERAGRPVIDGRANFPIAWFTQRQHALDWLGRE